MSLPAWMTVTAPGGMPPALAAAAPVHPRRLWRRAVLQLTRAVASVLVTEDTAARGGFLQGLDTRGKLLGILLLLVTATLLHALPLLALLAAGALAAGLASRIPPARLLRSGLMAGLFTALIAAPATLNLITPGPPVLRLWEEVAPAHGGVSMTGPGLVVAGRLVLRVLACVLLVQLLAATTRPERLFGGLRTLGVPALFVMLLSMMQRYLVLLLRIAEETHLGHISRSLTAGRVYEEQGWVAAGIGSLFRRTYALANLVFLAMLARGYTGEAHLYHREHWRPRDTLFCAACGAVTVVLLCAGR